MLIAVSYNDNIAEIFRGLTFDVPTQVTIFFSAGVI